MRAIGSNPLLGIVLLSRWKESKSLARNFSLSKYTSNALRFTGIREYDATYCQLVATYDEICFNGT
jgi:hypothetical protein